MKRLILLHIVCCCFLVGKADYEMNTDSLIQVFQNLPHDSTRLVALNNIIRIEQNNPKCIQFSDTLMKEALFQKDDKYAGLAAYYHLLYYYNHNKTDSVAKWITQMEPHVHKSGTVSYTHLDVYKRQILSGADDDDFIPIEDLPSEKIELPTELFGKFEATKTEPAQTATEQQAPQPQQQAHQQQQQQRPRIVRPRDNNNGNNNASNSNNNANNNNNNNFQRNNNQNQNQQRVPCLLYTSRCV